MLLWEVHDIFHEDEQLDVIHHLLPPGHSLIAKKAKSLSRSVLPSQESNGAAKRVLFSISRCQKRQFRHFADIATVKTVVITIST